MRISAIEGPGGIRMTIPEYELIRSARKTLRIEVRAGRLIVRAPLHMPQKRIIQFLDENQPWIHKKLEAFSMQCENCQPLSCEQLTELADAASNELVAITLYYASKLGKTVTSITIRAQRTRWGSCSSKGSLSFNALVMLTPPEIRRSVAAHEVCHLIHMDHSAAFYETLEQLCPDYRECRKWLRENGDAVLSRLPDGISVTKRAYSAR